MTKPEPTDDFPFPTKDKHDAPSPATEVEREPSEDAIDQGIAESFPASDPVSVSVTKIEKEGEDGSKREGK